MLPEPWEGLHSCWSRSVSSWAGKGPTCSNKSDTKLRPSVQNRGCWWGKECKEATMAQMVTPLITEEKSAKFTSIHCFGKPSLYGWSRATKDTTTSRGKVCDQNAWARSVLLPSRHVETALLFLEFLASYVDRSNADSKFGRFNQSIRVAIGTRNSGQQQVNGTLVTSNTKYTPHTFCMLALSHPPKNTRYADCLDKAMFQLGRAQLQHPRRGESWRHQHSELPQPCTSRSENHRVYDDSEEFQPQKLPQSKRSFSIWGDRWPEKTKPRRRKYTENHPRGSRRRNWSIATPWPQNRQRHEKDRPPGRALKMPRKWVRVSCGNVGMLGKIHNWCQCFFVQSITEVMCVYIYIYIGQCIRQSSPSSSCVFWRLNLLLPDLAALNLEGPGLGARPQWLTCLPCLTTGPAFQRVRLTPLEDHQHQAKKIVSPAPNPSAKLQTNSQGLPDGKATLQQLDFALGQVLRKKSEDPRWKSFLKKGLKLIEIGNDAWSHPSTTFPGIDGKTYRKHPYLMVKSMVSCNMSH